LGFALKNAFAIVTLSALLSACAVAPKQQPAQDTSDQPLAAAEAQRRGAQDEPKSEENVPNVAMTSTMMSQLMQAEMAFKNGDWQGPYITLLSLAQQTKDPRLAKRAAEMALSAKQADDALAAVRLWRQFSPNSDEANQYYLGLVILSDKLGEAENILKQRLADATPGARGLVMFQMQQLLLRAKDKEAARRCSSAWSRPTEHDGRPTSCWPRARSRAAPRKTPGARRAPPCRSSPIPKSPY
jgi:predicted Zn-dependent protease